MGVIPQAQDAQRVVVLGSANVDTTVSLACFPRPGETVRATATRSGLGGKGANQAVAARMAGVRTCFVGMIGTDANGELVRRTLLEHDVDTTALLTDRSAPTGTAQLMVDQGGENTIVVTSGANGRITPVELDAPEVTSLLDEGSAAVGLAQGEVPPETVAVFAARCESAGLRFVLNLAPFMSLPARTLQLADPLIVNEGEALALLDRPAGGTALDVDGALDAVRWLASTVARSAVITLGAAGAVAADGGSAWWQSSPTPSSVVDTTGAGDALVGATAARLGQGADLVTALRWGAAAGAAAVTEPGAVDSYGALAGLTPARAPVGIRT